MKKIKNNEEDMTTDPDFQDWCEKFHISNAMELAVARAAWERGIAVGMERALKVLRLADPPGAIHA